MVDAIPDHPSGDKEAICVIDQGSNGLSEVL
jgi:hypothetical protein